MVIDDRKDSQEYLVELNAGEEYLKMLHICDQRISSNKSFVLQVDEELWLSLFIVNIYDVSTSTKIFEAHFKASE